MSCPVPLRIALGAGIVMMTGCRLGVPIHVWRPPSVSSTVGKRVVVSDVVGPKDVAAKVKHKLLAMAPDDAGRATTFVDSINLQNESEIQLVSATDDEPNDLVLASIARRSGADFLLRGEVIEDRNPLKKQASTQESSAENLKISWRLTGLDQARSGGGSPVVIDVPSAIDRYPDLAAVNDSNEILTTAAVRETYRLFTPAIDRARVEIAIPYLIPGSRMVRRGNAAALSGRWGEAESIWSEVARQHPTQVAAIHNLALAAAAGQDFSRARSLASKAVRLQPTALHKQTLAWIELKQRDYHQAFGLPDPPEGWFVTNDTGDN